MMKITIEIPENASIQEIIKAVLKVTDYDGLRGEECGCLEGDFGICNDGLIDPNCQLGYVRWCKDCDKHDECEIYSDVKDCDSSVQCCVQLKKQVLEEN